MAVSSHCFFLFSTIFGQIFNSFVKFAPTLDIII